MEAVPSLPRLRLRRISDAAYEILREKIISREFVPGQRLDLDSIEKQLGISRTPIKEALTRLDLEGLVEIVPRSGTYITNPTPDDITESFEVRRALEVFAVELIVQQASDEDIKSLWRIVQELGELAAAEDHDAIYPRYLSLDYQFHQQLVAIAGNQRLCRAHGRENLHAQMARIRYRRSERELNVAQEEHEHLMAALEARDAEAAKAELDDHLRRAQRSLLDDMGE